MLHDGPLPCTAATIGKNPEGIVTYSKVSPLPSTARSLAMVSPKTVILGAWISRVLAAPQLLGREHTITDYVSIPEGGAEGVLACIAASSADGFAADAWDYDRC